MARRLLVSIAASLLVGLLFPAPSSAHQSLRKGGYECWLSQIGQYSNYILKIKSGGRYAFTLDDKTVGKAGDYVHDGKKVRFKNGYLKKKGYRGKHLVDDGTHVIYLYKNGELVYDCNNN